MGTSTKTQKATLKFTTYVQMEPRLRDGFMSRLRTDPKVDIQDLNYYTRAMDIIDKYIYEDPDKRNYSRAKSATKRPKTAVWQQPSENYLSKKPSYNVGIREKNMRDKNFDFKQKTFKTIVKKNDPVARMNQLKNEWKKSKFISSNGSGNREGRKLNVAEREAVKPKGVHTNSLKVPTRPKSSYGGASGVFYT